MQALSTPSSAGLKPQIVVDEDIVDFKQIDKVLSELAAMSGRWNLFRKFLFDSLSVIYSPSFYFPGVADPENSLSCRTMNLIQELRVVSHIRWIGKILRMMENKAHQKYRKSSK